MSKKDMLIKQICDSEYPAVSQKLLVLNKFLQICILMFWTEIAFAIVFNVPTSDPDGNFTITWSGGDSFVHINEKDNPQPLVSYGPTSGSLTLTRPSGVHEYTLTNAKAGQQFIYTYITKSILVGGVPPTVSSIADITINKNSHTGNIAFTISDNTTPVNQLTITAHSSNSSLIPPSNLVLSGSGTTRYINATPVANAIGSSVITIRVIDSDNLITVRTFTVFVQDVPAQFGFVSPTSLTGVYTLTWSNAKQFAYITERLGTTGSWINITGQAAPSGSHTITKIQNGNYYYQLHDCYYSGGGTNGNPICTVTDTRMVAVTFPAPNVAASLSPTTINEGGTATLTWNSTHAVSCSATGIGGVSAASGSVVYTAPTVMSSNQMVNIPVSCTGGGGEATAIASINVNWVNDNPTISAITNRTINEDTSTGAITFSVADEETPPDSLMVTATSSNTTLIPIGNLVLGGSGVNRTITVTPAAHAHGAANINVRVADAHGASAQRAFTVTVNPLNDAPTISAITSISIDENQSTGARSFTVGDIDTALSSLIITTTSSNTTLVPNGNIVLGGSGSSRTINVTPLPDKSGTANITVTVSDGQLSTYSSFLLTVNDLPAKFNEMPATSNTGVYTVSWSGAKQFAWIDERINILGTWVNGDSIQVGSTGSRAFTKTENGTYSYSIRDCYNTGGPPNGNPVCTVTDTRNVVVTFPGPVITANFTPSTINEGGSSTLTWSATHAQTCSATGINGVSGTSGSTGYTASSVMSTNQVLNAVISCTGQGPSTSTKTASLTINAINDVPTISVIANQSIQEDQPGGTGLINFTVADEETAAASLVVVATSNNQSLVPNANIALGGSGTNRTIRVTPATNAFGTATISVTVSDGQQTSSPRTFTVTVASVNDVPTLSVIPDQRINTNGSTPTLNFTVGDIETPAASLAVTAVSDKPGLVAASGIVLGGSGSSRTLKVTPVAGQSGLATITVKVTDANGTFAARDVKVSVLATTDTLFNFNDAPPEFIYGLTGGLASLGSGEFVATTQGNLNVDGGTASYSVAIDLPPAIRDLAPKLALSYSSRGGDGLMGVGWNLSGLSSIHRCRTSFATEGAEAQKSNPRYSNGDRLCLDGQTLEIATSTSPANDSTYWTTGAEYRTEVDTFTRIQSYGSHNGAHEYFTVTTKDGRTLTFGREESSQNSRIYAPGQPNGPINTWALDKVEDRYGNEYVVHYLRDTAKGEYYPSHIIWEPESAVVFSYINRTGSTPWGYDAGHKYERTKLLDKVTTYIGVTNSTTPTAGTKVKEYDVEHQLSATTGRHLVREISECGFTTTGSRQCAKPITFEWQLGALGFEQTATPLELTDGRWIRPSDVGQFDDVDGDGYTDLVGRSTVTAWGSPSGLFIPSGFNPDTGSQYITTLSLSLINTHQGKRGIILQRRNVITQTQMQTHYDVYLAHFNRTTGVVTSSLITTSSVDGSVVTGDFNNDGLGDFAFNEHIWLQNDIASNISFAKSLVVGKSVKGAEIAIIDFNNDGLNDFTYVQPKEMYQVNQVNWFYGHSSQKTHFNNSASLLRHANPILMANIPGAPYGRKGQAPGVYRTLVDLNGDGLQDYLYQHFVFSTTDNPGQRPDNWYVSFATGNYQFGEHYAEPQNTGVVVAPLMNSQMDDFVYSTQYSFNYDYNKDGVEDVILFKTNSEDLHFQWSVFYSGYQNGQLTLTDSGIDPFFSRANYLARQPVVGQMDNMFRGDINNDGLLDIIFSSSMESSSHFIYHAAKQQQPDLLIKVTDGFGAVTELDYSPLVGDDNNGKPLYTPDSTPPTFPQAPVDRSMQVVKKLSVNNGIGGKVHTYFNYTGGKRDLQGRGFLGFAKIETTNTGSGVETATHYLQTFPYTGRVSEVLVKDSDTGNLVSRTQHHYTTHSNNGRFPYLDYSLQQDYQLLTSSQSNPLAVSKVDNSYDACGNLTSRTTVVGTGLSGTHVTGDLGTTALTNTIPNAGDDDCSDDFVTETTVTSTEAGGINPRTVTSAFVPNEQFDVYQQTVFEGTALEVVTTTNRDEQGIIINSGAVAADLNSATTADRTTVFSDYDKGIYPATVTNAKGHVATLAYDYRFGKVNQDADPNGLISSRVYDSLGRNVQETATDGTITELLSWYCITAPVACPGNAVYLVATRITNPGEPDKLGAPLSVTYYDSLQREVRSEVHSLDLTVVKSDTQYTAEGYVHRVSEPFTGFASYWTTYSNYDALGRANTVTGPDGGSLSVSYSRDGTLLKTTETVTVVTPDGNDTQITNRYTNALGQVTKVVDAHNTPVDYTYDAQGNLKTTVVNNNLLTTITVVHDLAGNKTRITDPDAGVIDFAYNGFGELRKQTWQPDLTGHNKSITYTYDTLGRQTGRTDLSASGNAISYAWTWDASGQLGLLASQSGNGYTESYGYDHLSRVQTLTTTIAGLSGSRVFTYGYDNFSRPTTTAYPGGLSVTRDYHASGIHVRTRDITGGANNTLWALGNQKNERGQSTHELYGNGVVTAHAYAENNGLLSGITSGRLTASNTVNDLHGDIQALSYEFDSLGNLHSRTTQRSDNNGLSFENTTESFAYDNLNRITTSTTNGLFSRFKDYDYDDLGNLTYRSDLGTLAYNRTGNAGVHAITAAGESGTPGYKTYAYDKYGNMTNRGGETITYDVFNKPLTISGSNDTTSFSYGPNHERFKQVGGGKTTYVINGGAYEEIIDTSTGAVTQKSYVDGFMVQTKIGSTTEITYLHKDHLGSTEAMTDVKGNLLNRMSFDVWGNRQKADWQSGIPAAGELNAFKTTKGYTGHEQLDQHNLVHMGGRVYDPTLGRFLSADLFIQSPYNTQSFNRYSYVFNNPLSLIDPTGYVSEDVFVTGQRLSNQDLMRQINHSLFVTSWFAQGSNAQDFAGFLARQGVTSFAYMESNGDTVVVNINDQASNASTARNGTAGDRENNIDDSVKNGEGLSLDAESDEWFGAKLNKHGEVILCIGATACSDSSNVSNASRADVVSAAIDLIPVAKKLRGIHGNSKRSDKPHHLYAIIDTRDGSIYKFGISGRSLNLDGTSKRANFQTDHLNRQFGAGTFVPTVLMKNIPGRMAALTLEYSFVYGYSAVNGQKPIGNKRP